jgi:hypothetical protein
MCSNGTCQACRDAQARENSLSFRWRNRSQSTVSKNLSSPKEGDLLPTSFLDMALIAKMLSQGKEGGGKSKEGK